MSNKIQKHICLRVLTANSGYSDARRCPGHPLAEYYAEQRSHQELGGGLTASGKEG